jgi:sulfoxide reductase heme-binding subunit YedZ
MRPAKIDWFRVFVHTAALAPLALLIWDYTQDLLSVNPIEDITRRTGRTALTLLVLSLACTPANTVFGFKRALTVRRALGLYAFMYAGLHFLTFVVLDYGLDLGLIGDTIAEKRYVLIGLAAFLLLLPMALTSTKGWMKRMGRNWKTLHRFVYLAGVLAVVHFVWLVKSDITEPVRFGIVVLVLLGLRIPIVRKTISNTRNRLTGLIGGARSKRQTLQVSHNSTVD